MRRIVTIIISVIMGAAFAVPSSECKCKAEFVEPENSFCIYGVSGMEIMIEAGSDLYDVINYTFPNGASHFDKPYVISQSKISEWYSHGVDIIHIIVQNCSAITLTNSDNIISASPPDGTTMTETMLQGNDGTPLSLTTYLLALKRMYLFPTGTMPNTAGVTPTPFVNDGSDVVIDDNELNNTISSVNDFQPFIQFIFKFVMPWAGFAGLIILVFATIKFMLRG